MKPLQNAESRKNSNVTGIVQKIPDALDLRPGDVSSRWEGAKVISHLGVGEGVFQLTQCVQVVSQSLPFRSAVGFSEEFGPYQYGGFGVIVFEIEPEFLFSAIRQDGNSNF